MTPQEIIEYCEKQLALGNSNVGFMLPGRWGKRNTRRLWPGGPEGEIVAELPRGIFVMFDAKEVLKQVVEALEKQTPKKPKEHYNWCDFSGEEKKENARWFCSSCDGVIDESRAYCPSCGQRLDWGSGYHA